MPETPIPEAPTSEAPARKPNPAYTDEEKRLISEVYQRPEVNKNVAAVVATLQVEHPKHAWDYMRVYRHVSKTFALAAQHPSKSPKLEDAAQIVERTPLLAPAELAEAKALAKQEKTLSVGDWVDLGLTEEQGKRMLSMERFSRQPLKHMIRTTHGGLMFSLATLVKNFEETAKRLQDNDLPEEFDKAGDARPAIDVERDWHHLLLDYSKEIRAITDQVTRSNVLLLKAEQMAGETKTGKKKGKPGFGPMLVKAEPGSTLHLHGGK